MEDDTDGQKNMCTCILRRGAINRREKKIEGRDRTGEREGEEHGGHERNKKGTECGVWYVGEGARWEERRTVAKVEGKLEQRSTGAE